MSTSPDNGDRADDHLVTVISRWLARHASDDDLRRELERADRRELDDDQASAVEELQAELGGRRDRPVLERVARETLETLALGG